MVSFVSQKGWCVFVCVLCVSLSLVRNVIANVRAEGTLLIEVEKPIALTDENFICATLDWWPPEQCNFGKCAWGNSSLLNLDLENVILKNAIKAFEPLTIRLGGTLQDKLIYQTEGSSEPCTPFVFNASQITGFTEGCLPLARWDELNYFFQQTKAEITFGLNVLNGKEIHEDPSENGTYRAIATATATGPWNYSNAESFIQYTVRKGYKVIAYELGNEAGGIPAIGVAVAPEPYAEDTIALHRVIEKAYKGAPDSKPLIMAPGGFVGPEWYEEYIHKASGSLDVATHHIYNLGAGVDPTLVDKILNASYLDTAIPPFEDLHNIIEESGTSTTAWISEAGGAFQSGGIGVSNAFVYGFWYVDILGIASVYDTKKFCRQTLIGGNYGLLDITSFLPNPDYYSALLWHRLVGRTVLSTRFIGTKNIRAYAHCAKQSQGVTLVLINLDGDTTVEVNVNDRHLYGFAREEYHLTPEHGNILSRTVLLNGKALNLDSSGAIPSLEPVFIIDTRRLPIIVNPHSIVFVHMPDAAIPACEYLNKRDSHIDDGLYSSS